MSCELIMTVEKMESDHQAWLDMRKTGIGGSDASIIIGLNKWKSAFELWLEKTNQITVTEQNDNEFLYWGHVIEQLVADRFCELTGKKVRKCGTLRSKEHPFMLADVDRLIVGENAILECKNTASWKGSEWKGDDIPDAYYVQVQHYMAVGGYDKAYIACLVGGNKFVWKEIPRNDEEIDALIKAESEFWEKNVVDNIPPSVDDTESCAQAIQAYYKGGDIEPEVLEGEYDMLCSDLEALKEDKKKLEAVIKEKENKLKARLGNNNFGFTNAYNCWFKPATRETFDSKRFAKDYPDLYGQYKKTSTYRTLKISKSKERKEE